MILLTPTTWGTPALSHSVLQLNVHMYLWRTGAQGLLPQHHTQLGGRHQGVVGEDTGGRGEDPGRRYQGPGTERGVGWVETVRYPGNITAIT